MGPRAAAPPRRRLDGSRTSVTDILAARVGGPGRREGPWGLETQRSIMALREPARRQAGSPDTGTGQMMHRWTRMAEDPVMHAPDSGFKPLATLSNRLKCRRGRDVGISFGHRSPGMTG